MGASINKEVDDTVIDQLLQFGIYIDVIKLWCLSNWI